MSNYVLAPAYAGVQYWNADKSDLVEVRRSPGEAAEVPSDIPADEAKRLLELGAIVEASSAQAEAAQAESSPEEPKGNASRDEWAGYADSLGLTVEQNASREDIKRQIAESRS